MNWWVHEKIDLQYKPMHAESPLPWEESQTWPADAFRSGWAASAQHAAIPGRNETSNPPWSRCTFPEHSGEFSRQTAVDGATESVSCPVYPPEAGHPTGLKKTVKQCKHPPTRVQKRCNTHWASPVLSYPRRCWLARRIALQSFAANSARIRHTNPKRCQLTHPQIQVAGKKHSNINSHLKHFFSFCLSSCANGIGIWRKEWSSVEYEAHSITALYKIICSSVMGQFFVYRFTVVWRRASSSLNPAIIFGW